MAGLWIDLRSTLSRLDALAADPELTLEADALPALQYELHSAGELVVGLEPPADSERCTASSATRSLRPGI